jgi:hypothetical protein
MLVPRRRWLIEEEWFGICRRGTFERKHSDIGTSVIRNLVALPSWQPALHERFAWLEQCGSDEKAANRTIGRIALELATWLAQRGSNDVGTSYDRTAIDKAPNSDRHLLSIENSHQRGSRRLQGVIHWEPWHAWPMSVRFPGNRELEIGLGRSLGNDHTNLASQFDAQFDRDGVGCFG